MPVSFDLHTPSTGNPKKDVPTEYIRIVWPDYPDVVAHRAATDVDRRRHQAEYERFRKGLEGKEP